MSHETFGLLGYPLGHSFSAGFFAKKFLAESIDAEYLNFEAPSVEAVNSEILPAHPDLVGFNVTIPHKQAIIPLLSQMSDEAREIGAVNVVRVLRETTGSVSLRGYNSDVIGFSRSLQPLLTPADKHALVLGTGGASKAVVYALRKLGISFTYVSRTAAEGRIAYENVTPEVLASVTLIVNCTPVGMHPHVDECPPLPYEALGQQHLLYDLVYNPLETAFLRHGRQAGARVKNGLEMLHLQAEASWEFWHEKL